MIEPHLIPIAQKGFAKTSSVLLSKTFSGPWWDRESFFLPHSNLPVDRPVFFYSTHSSWWDPMVAALIAVEVFKSRAIAPMDEAEFVKYKSLRFAGLFGVRPGEGPQVEDVIHKEFEKFPETRVWVTPQGNFAPNELPQPEFKQGLSRWSLGVRGIRVPVSIHYFFGAQAKPGLFIRVGQGQPVSDDLVKKFASAKDSVEKSQVLKEDSEFLRQALNEETKTLLEKIHKAHQSKGAIANEFLKVEGGIL